LLFLFLRPQKKDILFWAGLLKQARDSYWTIPLFLTGAVLASLVSFPISIVLILGGVLFGALWGTILNWTGALFGATASYLVGQYFGRPLIRRFGGEKIEAVNQWIQKKGFWAILLLRIVGIFPFTIVNICAGTSRMTFARYLFGTAIGMAPGTFLISYFADSIIEGALHFSSGSVQLFVGLALLFLWLGASLLKKWWLRPYRTTNISRLFLG
ncbi:MAG TPA: VTT domain-containing protein, partial [Candidatus Manganitrophaceae bacterium]